MIRFLTVLILIIFLFFLQQQRILSIWEINPNFMLAGLVAIAFTGFFNWQKFLLFLVVLFPVLIIFSGTFWLLEISILLAVAFLSYFAGRWLTGRRWLDFPLLLAGGQLLFYLPGGFVWPVFLGELAYNFLVGLCLVLILKKF